MMTNKKVIALKNYLDEILSDAKCALNYTKDYELVIAVMLSAQTTDKSVNKVTEVLFAKFPTLESLKNASFDDVYQCIKSLGLAKNKANNIIQIANRLVDVYDGKVPQNKEDLETLSGVGNKTANVVRAELFSIPEIAVDTHILRITKRLKLVDEDATPLDVEKKLRKLLDEKDYIKTHHQLIHFGRNICIARTPHCDVCKMCEYCGYYKKPNR